MKQPKNTYWIVLIVSCTAIIFHFSYINELPAHIHAWAQADYYSITLRFLENGFNFFKPEGFVLNQQFPHKFLVPAETSITATDFPIHPYIVAILMKVMGTTSPWVYRVYTVFYSLLGLIFLFKLSNLIIKDVWKSCFLVLFAATSPLFVYYQGGFLPGIISLSNTFIGLYFYIQYLETKNNRAFNLGLFFITLATLSRTTFLIVLCAVLLHEGIRFLKKEITLKSKGLPLLLVILSIGGYYLYNGYLRKVYASTFLNYLLPPTDLEDIQFVIKGIISWGLDYFSAYHYVTILIMMGVLLFFKIKPKQWVTHKIAPFVGIIFLGNIAFFIVMMLQFINHDYYFLDTFFLPIILSVMVLLSFISINYQKVVISFLSIVFVVNASFAQQKRHEYVAWDATTQFIQKLKGSDELLTSLGFSKKAKVLVFGPKAPNVPFMMLRRKGYAIMKTNPQTVQKALTWDYDCIVVEKDFFLKELYKTFPEIIKTTKRIGGNDDIIVAQKVAKSSCTNVYEYLGENEKTYILY